MRTHAKTLKDMSELPNIQDIVSTDFASVLNITEQHRTNAINKASILTAWEVGAFVSDRINKAKWGTKVVGQGFYCHGRGTRIRGWEQTILL